ncbi:MAG: aldehyde ferredoxin oxidoreductase family protein [Deltaproteobacteria bacterium]|nr:aldehyde ferredoxin oxidoreductase family protein [Deltaproteobacteria bacterium]
MKGYAGKITYVDLTSKKIWDERFDEPFARKYFGGNGFAAKVLYDRLPAGAEPLAPENAFIVCTGPLNGTLAHGSGRAGIITKSPLTGYFMDSYFGGDFGARLKQSGRDMIVVLGKSSEPVAIFCDDDEVTLLPAQDLWGMTTRDAQDSLSARLGKGISTLCCGPAGENLAPMACSIGGRRAAGRGGTGAVMGFKNLKAISVRGTKDIEVSDIKGLLKFHEETRGKYLALTPLAEIGTPYLVEVINALGGLGTHNWQNETWDQAEKISGDRLLEGHFVRNQACFACSLGGCTRVVQSIRSSGIKTEGPEYETLYALGSNCGVDDLDTIIEVDRLCDDYGIDTISLGGSIGFVMECFQQGLLSIKDTDGIDFSFGKDETLVTCAHLVAKREGFGDFLAQGVKAMAEKIGQGSEKFACHIRGLESPGHSSRGLKILGIGYAVSPRGGSHQDARPGPEYPMGREERQKTEGKALMAYNSSNWSALCDAMIVCRFCEGVHGVTVNKDHAALINLTVGWDMTPDALTDIGRRIHALERSFNCREGLRRKDDTLPYRFMHEGIPSGYLKGLRTKPEELQEMLDAYYGLRGWDSDGVPKRETLDALGLEGIGF